jgi:hypothetical protein
MLRWLFPQEKSTLYELKKVYVYSENALKPYSMERVCLDREITYSVWRNANNGFMSWIFYGAPYRFPAIAWAACWRLVSIPFAPDTF